MTSLNHLIIFTEKPLSCRKTQFLKRESVDILGIFVFPMKYFEYFLHFLSIENPFPQQGSVITIKLSEDTEVIDQKEGPQTMFVEMLFEMNYETGHWRRLRRTRVLSQQGT